MRWDPKSASEAELRTMEQHLDELGREVALARQGYDKEKREADAIQALSQQRMAAAEQLQRQVDGESDPARKAALEKSLETLVSMLEQMAPEVEREKAEEVDAKDYLTMLEQTYADAGGKLKSARSELDRAQRDMGRAAQQREQAERQAEAARRAAGLASSDEQSDRRAQGDAGCSSERPGLGRCADEQGEAAAADETGAGRPQHRRRARRRRREVPGAAEFERAAGGAESALIEPEVRAGASSNAQDFQVSVYLRCSSGDRRQRDGSVS